MDILDLKLYSFPKVIQTFPFLKVLLKFSNKTNQQKLYTNNFISSLKLCSKNKEKYVCKMQNNKQYFLNISRSNIMSQSPIIFGGRFSTKS